MRMKRAVVVAIGLAVALGGCGSQALESADGLSPERPAGSAPMPAVEPDDRFATGVPASAPEAPEPPPAPDTLEALATDSIDEVVALHNVLAARASASKAPKGALAGQASDVRDRLAALRARIGVTRKGAGVKLASVVEAYRRVAERAAREGDAATGSTGRLKTLDGRWRGVLLTIGRASGLDITSRLPRLLMPRRTPARAPERKAR